MKLTVPTKFEDYMTVPLPPLPGTMGRACVYYFRKMEHKLFELIGSTVHEEDEEFLQAQRAALEAKAMMEKMVCSQNQKNCQTVFCCVRYGNVMGSRGSVIPLFLDQLEQGQPLTVTVPEMTRFLLTLDQSVELVFHAMTQARGGEIFVRKAPACTIQALADTIRQRAGQPDYPIKITGIRRGEKLHEVLVNEYEMQRVSEQEEFYTIYPDDRFQGEWTPQPLGSEFASHNTRQLLPGPELESLLDAMGDPESFH